jgi:hypothetical protein
MTKKRNNKKQTGAYKPTHFLQNDAIKKSAPQKKQKVEDDDKLFKNELQVTPDMFEAARRMKQGVTHIKDLDMSLVKRRNTLKTEAGSCDVTTIDIQTSEVKTTARPVKKESLRFDFNSKDHFNTDSDSTDIAKQAWDWLLNPIGVENFV